MMEPGTGNVTAMAQNLEYGEGKNASYINNAVDLKYSGTNGQQPGSTFKIFTIAAAIEQGAADGRRASCSPSSREMPYGSYQDCEGNTQDTWPVTNYSGAPAGTYDMYGGTALSINTYFAELAKRTGLCNVWDVASRAGVTRREHGGGPTRQHELPGHSRDHRRLVRHVAAHPRRVVRDLRRAWAALRAPGHHRDPHDRPRRRSTSPSPTANRSSSQRWLTPSTTCWSASSRTARRRGNGPRAAHRWQDRHDQRLPGAVVRRVHAEHGCRGVDRAPRAPSRYPMANVTINGVYKSAWAGSTLPGPIWKIAMLGALADVPVGHLHSDRPRAHRRCAAHAAVTRRADARRRRSSGSTHWACSAKIADDEVASYQPEGTVAYTSPGAGSSVQPGSHRDALPEQRCPATAGARAVRTAVADGGDNEPRWQAVAGATRTTPDSGGGGPGNSDGNPGNGNNGNQRQQLTPKLVSRRAGA